VLRNALDGVEDAFVLRAAELFFRPQRATIHEGAALLADAETIEGHERDRHAHPLLSLLGGPAVAELDVLDEANADAYFERSDAFDMVLNLSQVRARRGLAAAIGAWLRHLLAVEVMVEPVERLEDEDFAWFVGLDAEATRIGNALWEGEELQDEEAARVLALFRLAFRDSREVLPSLGARPVWLILAMSPEGIVRMKPQNLVALLPLRAAEALS